MTHTPWFVYFIECRNGSIYTGATTDVDRRYHQNAAGKGARYLRMHPPVRLLGFIEVETKSAALSAELRFKRLSVSAKRARLAALRR